MPAGRYKILGDDGHAVGTEEFRCAPGSIGWRYFSDIETADPEPHHEIVDLVADSAWGPDMELDYASPAYNVVTANRLQRTAEFEVVLLEPVTCEPVIERQRYDLLGDEEVETPGGRFTATRWRYTALASGSTADMWIAGDVLVRYLGVYELEWYEPGVRGPRVLA